MIRYLYPLIILVLILLFCGCIPQPFSEDSIAGVRGNRPTSIDLHNQELRFQDSHGLFMGAESDINHLRQVIDVMCDLAEAIENIAT